MYVYIYCLYHCVHIVISICLHWFFINNILADTMKGLSKFAPAALYHQVKLYGSN